MKTYVQPGEMIDITASGADIAVDSVVVVGNQLVVAAVDIADGDTGAASAGGVHRLPKTAGAVIAQGDAPVWDASAGAFVAQGTVLDTGDVGGAATCWVAPADADTEVLVKINTGIGTVGA